MNITNAKRSAAAALLVALAACSGAAPSGTNPMPAVPSTQRGVAPRQASAVVANIVGVGDSLTAGYQAGGFLGALGVKNPLSPGTIVPPGQEFGWWADLYEQATGFPPKDMFNKSLSPLPLIAGPGLANQVVASATSIIGELKSGNSCSDNDGFNQAAFSLSNLARVRLNPTSTKVRDLGVPGITLHEALTMIQPLTPTCQSIAGTPGLLSEVVNSESESFYPVLGGFASQIPAKALTMVNAAASLNPSLATVWLGANDILKYMGSGGLFVGGDSTVAQVETDLRSVIAALQHRGALVVVANLPNVLETPYFMNTSIPKDARACEVQTYFYCLLTDFGVYPDSKAAAITKEISAEYGLTPAGTCVPTSLTAPCGYLTLQGALTVVAAVATGAKPPSLNPSGPGSGLGANYITPAFAAKIQALNGIINQGIDQAASAQQAPLVDVATIFQGIASGDPSNQYFHLAQVNPGVCCTLAFLGGLVSFDGLHPSNTGYAIIAYEFIKTINRAFGTAIPQVPIKKIYAGEPPYAFADPYAPQMVRDLLVVSNGHGGLTIHYEDHGGPY